jgi:hypothetical protein
MRLDGRRHATVDTLNDLAGSLLVAMAPADSRRVRGARQHCPPGIRKHRIHQCLCVTTRIAVHPHSFNKHLMEDKAITGPPGRTGGIQAGR